MLQELGHLLDRYFCQQNDEYKQKLASGRLKPLHARQLKPGTATHFRAHMVKRGQKDGQFKVQCLAYKDEVDFDFSSRLAAESAHMKIASLVLGIIAHPVPSRLQARLGRAQRDAELSGLSRGQKKV